MRLTLDLLWLIRILAFLLLPTGCKFKPLDHLRPLLLVHTPDLRVVFIGPKSIRMDVLVGVIFVPPVNLRICRKLLVILGGRRPWKMKSRRCVKIKRGT